MVDAAHARELIARSIARHGGDRWSRIARLTLPPRTLTGLVPWVKGNGRTFGLPSHAELEPQIARATFFDYPRAGERGCSTPAGSRWAMRPSPSAAGVIAASASCGGGSRWMRCIFSGTR